MKKLKSYLNPKSQWHGVTGFPETPDAKEIIKFLSNNGFKKVYDPSLEEDSIYYMLKWNLSNSYFTFTNIYDNYTGDYYIAFHGIGTKVTEQDPIFGCVISTKKNDKNLFYIEWDKNIAAQTTKWKEYDTYEEFRETVNKFFKW